MSFEQVTLLLEPKNTIIASEYTFEFVDNQVQTCLLGLSEFTPNAQVLTEFQIGFLVIILCVVIMIQHQIIETMHKNSVQSKSETTLTFAIRDHRSLR